MYVKELIAVKTYGVMAALERSLQGSGYKR